MKYVSPQTEKRKRQQQRRKKQMFLGAVVVALVLIIIVVAAVIMGGRDKPNGDIPPNRQEQPTDEQTPPIDTEQTAPPQPSEPDDTPDGSGTQEQSAQKPAKKKKSIFSKIKSIFAKTQPMEYTFPAMAFGRNIETPAQSIISLSPMATEFILSSPSQNALIAVSGYCNKYGFDSLMTVGTPLLPNVDKIIQLAPDYLIVQTPLSEVDRVTLEQSGIVILQLNAPESFDDIKEIYRSVTALTCGSEIASFESERVVSSIQAKLDMYNSALANIEKQSAVVVFNSYGMVATKDTFEGKLLSNFFDIEFDGVNYYCEDFSAVTSSNPQVIIASDYIGEDELKNMGFGDSEAFANGNVYYINIQQLENLSAKTIGTLAGIANSVYGDKITAQVPVT